MKAKASGVLSSFSLEFIVDSNYLNGPEIESFLKKSSHNKVVLTDFLVMEALKSVDIQKTRRSFKTLSRFPNQVITLKGTEKICGMSGRTKRLKRRLISNNPNSFKDLCTLIYSDDLRHKEAIENLLSEADATKKYFQQLEKNTSKEIIDHFTGLEKKFSADEIGALRKGHSELPIGLIDKFFNLVSGLSRATHKKHPTAGRWPKDHEWPNTFIFRNTLFMALYFIAWLEKGSQKNTSLEKIRNDLVDLNFCTYATYFDGILTKDHNCRDMFFNGNDILKNLIIPMHSEKR